MLRSLPGGVLQRAGSAMTVEASGMEDWGAEKRPGTGIMLEWHGSGSTSMSALAFCHRKSWMLPARLCAAHRKHQTSTQCLLSQCPLAHFH